MIFQWIGMVEYIPCYSAPALRRGLLPATRLAAGKYLVNKISKSVPGQHSVYSVSVHTALMPTCLHSPLLTLTNLCVHRLLSPIPTRSPLFFGYLGASPSPARGRPSLLRQGADLPYGRGRPSLRQGLGRLETGEEGPTTR